MLLALITLLCGHVLGQHEVESS